MRKTLPIFAAALCLLSCSSGDITSLRLTVTFGGVKLDQVSLAGMLGGKVLFNGQRFPVPSRELVSGEDLIIAFPDEMGGQLLTLTVKGMHKAQQVAAATVSTTLVSGQQVQQTVFLGKNPGDAGRDGPHDGGVDLPPDKPLQDGLSKDILQPKPDLPPDLGPPPDKGCQVGTSICDNGKNVLTCVNSEAGPTQVVEVCPMGCVPVKCRSLVPSNSIPPSMLQSATVSFTPTSSYVYINTDNGTIYNDSVKPGVSFYNQTAPGVPIMVMAFKTITIKAGVTVKAAGKNALVLVASGPIEIEGVIDAAGSLYQAGAGGAIGAQYNSSAAGPGKAGDGCTKKVTFFPYISSRGGGGSHGGLGGTGGTALFGTESCVGGAAGIAYGNATLNPLTGGSGGGLGATNTNNYVPYGGGGGGAVQIVSGSYITVGAPSGALAGITVGGGGGSAGGTSYRGGGGGGSGGGLLLEAPEVSLLAGAIIAANGGGGAGGSGTATGATSGSAGSLDDKQTSAGSPSASGGLGGSGGGGTVMNGVSGTAQLAGGGGGGGIGIIRINTYSGKATINGKVSGSFSEGKVATSPP